MRWSTTESCWAFELTSLADHRIEGSPPQGDRRARAVGSRTGWLAIAAAVGIAGCGSQTAFANRPRPPVPVDLTVYIGSRSVALSPTRVGAGLLQFYITNESSRMVSLRLITPRGSTLADTGPINPQSTSQVTVDVADRGSYTLTTGTRSGISATTLHVGKPRPSADSVLLSP